MSSRQLYRALVAGCERRFLAVAAASPHGTHGVDDDLRLQPPGARDLRVARLASAQSAAFIEHRGAGGTMDGSVHAAAPLQGSVGGIYDGVRLPVRGDVPAVDRYGTHDADASANPVARARACVVKLAEGVSDPDDARYSQSSGTRKMIAGSHTGS